MFKKTCESLERQGQIQQNKKRRIGRQEDRKTRRQEDRRTGRGQEEDRKTGRQEDRRIGLIWNQHSTPICNTIDIWYFKIKFVFAEKGVTQC